MKKLFFAFLFLISTSQMGAQQTGSFKQVITFPQADYSETRCLYYYVPENYSADHAYKLVVGFRGGPHINAGEFRDQLRFLSDSIGAIILCPENSAHFWNEEGKVKKLFQYSVDTTMAMYNVDPNYIYLTGLSYGGRHAVIVSMDTDAGDIPNLRGVIPFAAGLESDLRPNYSSIDDFAPTCICIGLNDAQNFINVSHHLQEDITANGGVALLNEIPGVGHTVAFPTYKQETMECLNFIEGQYINPVSNQKTADIGLSISPNPASETIELIYRKNLHPQRLFLTNLNGRIIKTFTPDRTIIDISGVSTGAYFIILQTAEGRFSKKVIISE